MNTNTPNRRSNFKWLFSILATFVMIARALSPLKLISIGRKSRGTVPDPDCASFDREAKEKSRRESEVSIDGKRYSAPDLPEPPRYYLSVLVLFKPNPMSAAEDHICELLVPYDSHFLESSIGSMLSLLKQQHGYLDFKMSVGPNYNFIATPGKALKAAATSDAIRKTLEQARSDQGSAPDDPRFAQSCLIL